MLHPVGLPAVFEQYLAAFNARDLAALSVHLSPDLVFDWGEAMAPLVGRRAFEDFFTRAWSSFREHVIASDTQVDGSVLSCRITNHVDVFRDWPDCPLRPMAAGESFVVAGPMAYSFDGSRIARITDLTPATPPYEETA